jgi:hypothetical protein
MVILALSQALPVGSGSSRMESPTMKRLIALLLFLSLSPIVACTSNCDGSGNCYIRAGANGSGNGSNWTNACTGFTGACASSNMTRGVSYWVAAGGYGGVTFNAPPARSSVITINAATVANHGPAADWSNSFAGQALFGESTVTTDYWTFDGQSRGSDWQSGYNIKFWNQKDGGSSAYALTLNGNNLSVRYVEIEGTNGNYSGGADDAGMLIQGTHVNLGFSYVHDTGVDLIWNWGANTTFEYNYIARNHKGDQNAHAQAFATCGNTMIIRYNTFRNIVSSGVITDPTPNGCTISNWYIYGNTWFWDTSLPSNQGVGDGFVDLFGETSSGVIQIYNNTFAGINASVCNPINGSQVCNSHALFVCGSACGYSGCPGGNCGHPTVTVYNNLWWNPSSAQDVAVNSSGASWTATADYGQAYCPAGGCSYSGGFTSVGSHDLQSNSGNPFVNFNGSSNFDVSLKADTSPGFNIPNWATTPSGCSVGTNCENIDPLGVTRGANGTIDRGAFQINGTDPPPNPPTNLTATPH